MYFPIDYNCFVNQLYCKTKIVYKKGVTCKKKYANFIFALGDNDLQQYTNNVFLNLSNNMPLLGTCTANVDIKILLLILALFDTENQ